MDVKLAPNDSPITRAAGVPKLKQETSINASLGFSWTVAKPLTITLDGYYVQIKDRIVLTGYFNNTVAAIVPTLNSLNVANAQFYANAVNTTNYGLDLVVSYKQSWASHSLKSTLAGNVQGVAIDKINVPDALNDTYEHRQQFYSDRDQKYLIASAPPVKANLNLEYGYKKFSVGTNQTLYGALEMLGYGAKTMYPPQVKLDAGGLVPELFKYSAKLVSDFYASYKITRYLVGYLGADNVFNVHPNYSVVPGAKGSAYDGEGGGAWDSVQMNYNGRRLFVRLAFNL